MRELELSAKNVVYVLLIITGLLALFIAFPLLDAIAFGIALAYIAKPVAHSAREVLGNTLSALLTLGILTFAFLVFGLYAASVLVMEAQKLSTISYEQIEAIRFVQRVVEENPALQEWIQRTIDFVSTDVSTRFAEYGLSVYNFVVGLANFVVTVVLAFVIAFYLLKDSPKLKKALIHFFPEKSEGIIKTAMGEIDKNIEAMFVGSALTAVFTAMITSLVLLYLDVPYAVILGISAGILQFIPLIGAQILLVPLAVLLFLLGHYEAALGVVFLALFFILVWGTVIAPFIIERKARIHPVLVLVAFIGGAVSLGFKGFVIGPIIIASLKGLIETRQKLKSV
jgi:predicted PurR-regulated permease PerM